MLLFLLGLSAHTRALLNGAFLVALAAVWEWVVLTPATKRAAYGLVVGTSRSTPLHGAGHAGTALAESVVAAGLTVGGVALLVAVALIVVGLRRRAPNAP